MRKRKPALASLDAFARMCEAHQNSGVVALARGFPLKRIDLVRAGLPARMLDETAAVLGIAKSALTKAAVIPVSTAGL